MSSSIREQLALYDKHSTNAGNLFYQNRKREGANEYWIAFSRYSPSLTHPNRWDIFRGYTSILKERYFEPSDDDWTQLKSVLKDKHELKLFRIEAGLALGLLYYDQGDRFESGEMYYKAIQIGETKDSKFEKKQLQKKVYQNQNLYTIEYLVKEVMTHVKENLEILTMKNDPRASSPFGSNNRNRSDGTLMPDSTLGRIIKLSPIVNSSMTLVDFRKLTSIGGHECDACGIKETKDNKLLQCRRCKRGFYCSKQCQATSWNVFHHKKYCRTQDTPIKAGDFVLLNGLKSKPELNYTVGLVVGHDPKSTTSTESASRWEIQLTCQKSTNLSIQAKNIKQLRPFDCLRRKG